jgi:hypothetical protein
LDVGASNETTLLMNGKQHDQSKSADIERRGQSRSARVSLLSLMARGRRPLDRCHAGHRSTRADTGGHACCPRRCIGSPNLMRRSQWMGQSVWIAPLEHTRPIRMRQYMGRPAGDGLTPCGN